MVKNIFNKKEFFNYLLLNSKAQFKKFSIVFLISIILLAIYFVSAYIIITPVSPIGNTVTDSYSFEITQNFTMNNSLDVVKFNFNNTNYTLEDSSVVLRMNFNNFSSLGENDTLVKDISKYGNNGTVYGGTNITWTPNGKYGGAFNFSGRVNYMLTGNGLVANYPFTVSAWVNPKVGVAMVATQIVDTTAANEYFDMGLEATGIAYVSARVGTPWQTSKGATVVSNNWYHLVGVWVNSTYRAVYVNGVLGSSLALTEVNFTAMNNFAIGMARDSSPGAGWNGSIDEVTVWNRTLSQSEITQLYRTQLTKYNSTNYAFYANESIRNENLSTTNLNESYDYGIYVNDTAGNSNSTLFTITRIPLLTSTLGNFTTTIGTINPFFYGANTHGKYLSDNVTQVDANGDNTREATTNQTWHRTQWENSKMNYMRVDMSLEYWTNNTDGSFSMPAWLERTKESVKYARDNNMKVLLVGGYMQDSLANKTLQCKSDNTSCGANNITRYGNLLMQALDYYTNNGEWNSTVAVSSWNEPFDAFLLEDAGTSASGIYNKSRELFPIHNITYTRIKAKYPNMEVGANIVHFGFGPTSNGSNYRPDWFFLNCTNQTDFIDIHIYKDADLSSRFNDAFPTLLSNISAYGIKSQSFIISEWNVFNNLTKNTTSLSSLYSQQVARFYSNILNTYPYNISMQMFEWSNEYHYANQSEYPQKWMMVSEPQMDNYIAPSYNITKNFASYCPSGSLVGSSISNNSYEKTVLTRKGNTVSLVITNTDTEAHNFTANVSLIGASNLRDLETNTLYTSVNGKLSFGLINGYDILYLANGIYGEYNGAYWNKPLNEITESNSNLTTVLKNTDTLSRTIELSNLTNALVYFGNLSSALSTNINSNDNGFNITTPTNVNLTILNDLNLTEGVTRENSPFWINSKTVTSNLIVYKIASNWSEQVNGLTFYPPASTPCPSTVSIIPNGSSASYSLTFSCGTFLNSITLNYINQSASSNTLSLVYAGSPGGGGGDTTIYYPTSWFNATNVTTNDTSPILVLGNCSIPQYNKLLNIMGIPTWNVKINQDCENIKSLSKFFNVEFINGQYHIIGVKLYVVLISIIIIMLVIKFKRYFWRR